MTIDRSPEHGRDLIDEDAPLYTLEILPGPDIMGIMDQDGSSYECEAIGSDRQEADAHVARWAIEYGIDPEDGRRQLDRFYAQRTIAAYLHCKPYPTGPALVRFAEMLETGEALVEDLREVGGDELVAKITESQTRQKRNT